MRPRPADLPRRLGADDPAAGGDDPRRAAPTAARRRTVFVYVAFTHLGGRGHVGRGPARRARGRVRRRHARSAQGSGLQVAIALAALVGMGTKAGMMPLHVWLPRAHPIAPAPVSALMSGVMIKVAIYGLVRVLVDWLGVLPLWIGVLVLARRRALGGRRRRLRALPARPEAAARVPLDRERRDHRARSRRLPRAARARRRRLGRARARRCAAAHAQPRRLQGAALPRRGRVRAGGRLARARPARRTPAADAVDRRRLPRRRDGDRRPAAAERLRLGVADAAGAPARARVRRRSATALAGALALAALAATAALAVLLLRQGRRARPARAAAARRGRGRGGGAGADAGGCARRSRGACVVLGVAPGLLLGALRGLAPWQRGDCAAPRPAPARAPGRCRRPGSPSRSRC